MATAVDGVILLTVAGETHRKAVTSALTTLRWVRANIVCIVLNKVTKELRSDYQAYSYYGKYYKRYYHAKSAVSIQDAELSKNWREEGRGAFSLVRGPEAIFEKGVMRNFRKRLTVVRQSDRPLVGGGNQGGAFARTICF